MTRSCAYCGREIGPNARRLEGFGQVGADCYQKLAAYPKFLKAHGLAEFAHGPVTIEALEHDGAWYLPEAARVLEAKLTRLGFCWTKQLDRDAGTVTLTLTQRNTPKSRKQFKNAYSQWRNRLIASRSMAEAREMMR